MRIGKTPTESGPGSRRSSQAAFSRLPRRSVPTTPKPANPTYRKDALDKERGCGLFVDRMVQEYYTGGRVSAWMVRR